MAPLIKPLFGDWFGTGDEIRSYMIVFGALLLSHAALNHVGIRAVARLNDISAVYHVAGVLIVVIALALFAPKQPVSFLFTRTFANPELGFRPYWFIFLGGLLQAQWTYTGYDASAHTVEETKDARVRAPWGVYLSVAVSGLFGYLMLAFVTLAIQDLDKTAAASNPFIYIFQTALGQKFGNMVLWVVTLAQWFCGLSCVTSTSRMIFAFSRDNGMPLSTVWAGVSRRFRTPAAAVWLAAALSFLLPCVILGLVTARPGRLDFGKLYPAVTGISTIGLYLSYGIPIWLKRRAVRSGLWTDRANGPWNLGKWSGPVGVVAILWIAFITVLFVLPPNDLTGYVFGGTLIGLIGLYMTTAWRRFRGPAPQAASPEELVALEAEFEHS